jgi:hypothetical protein
MQYDHPHHLRVDLFRGEEPYFARVQGMFLPYDHLHHKYDKGMLPLLYVWYKNPFIFLAAAL